jgi:hypothetical protein
MAGRSDGGSCIYTPGILGYVNQYTASGWVLLGSGSFQSTTCADYVAQLDANCESSLTKRIYYDGIEYIY